MLRTTIVITAALAAVLPAIPAQAAQVARTFLSAAGSDSNNCANVLTPCRHLRRATCSCHRAARAKAATGGWLECTRYLTLQHHPLPPPTRHR